MSDERSLGQSATSGARALLLGQLIKGGAQFAGLIVLSRLLDPAVFGVVAVAAVVVGVGEVVRDFGLSAAAMRETSLTLQQRSNLFWLNLAFGFVCAVAVAALAIPLELLFEMPDLAGVLAVLSVTFVVNGAAAQYRADLVRSLRFGVAAAADAVSAVVALAIAILLAFLGAGVWSMVAQSLTMVVIAAALIAAYGRWLPLRPRRGSGVQATVRFGGHFAVSQLFAYAGNNVDTLVLGVTATPAAVGIYSRAFQLVMAPLAQLRAPATTVALPVLAKVADDAQRTRRYLLRGQAALGYAVLPIVAVVAGATEPIVNIVLGPGWGDAVPVIRLLAGAAALQQMSTVANWAFIARGRGAELARYGGVAALVKIGAIVALASFGVLGVATGYLISVVVLWPVSIVWASRRVEGEASALIAQGVRLLIVATVAACLAFAASRAVHVEHAWAQLVVGVLAAASIYAVLLLVPAMRREMAVVMRLAGRSRG